jgi:hypothetical protein
VPLPIKPVTHWGVLAKTAGGLLNLNCALLLVGSAELWLLSCRSLLAPSTTVMR